MHGTYIKIRQGYLKKMSSYFKGSFVLRKYGNPVFPSMLDQCTNADKTI
jgi:hypothetical protein